MTFSQQGMGVLPGRTFIARHGETVFNAARRLQGEAAHTPLTRTGFAQADAMGVLLASVIDARTPLTLWSSDTGRALQTIAVMCEHLARDWHQVNRDPRLREIGMGAWGGRYYADVAADVGGPIIDAATGLLHPAPDGEDYRAIAARVTGWAQDAAAIPGDRLVVMHGLSSRVLRGVLTGRAPDTRWGAPIAPQLPQGSIVLIDGGMEQVVLTGNGGGHA